MEPPSYATVTRCLCLTAPPGRHRRPSNGVIRHHNLNILVPWLIHGFGTQRSPFKLDQTVLEHQEPNRHDRGAVFILQHRGLNLRPVGLHIREELLRLSEAPAIQLDDQPLVLRVGDDRVRVVRLAVVDHDFALDDSAVGGEVGETRVRVVAEPHGELDLRPALPAAFLVEGTHYFGGGLARPVLDEENHGVLRVPDRLWWVCHCGIRGAGDD